MKQCSIDVLPARNQEQPRPPLKVFLCHSSGDNDFVRRLYGLLKNSIVEPWLDEKNILGGQDWDMEIRKAVRSSDVVLVCLSRSAITKEGYVQKEIRQALDVASEKPPGTIFIIPIRIEPCDLPESVSKWQAINFFEVGAETRLRESLLMRAQSLGRYSNVEIDQLAEAFSNRARTAQELGSSYAEEAKRLREIAFGTAVSQMEMNQAAAEASDRADSRLLTLLNAIKEYYSPPRIAQFDKVQKAWEIYRNANARMAAAEYKGGSIVPLIYSSTLESVSVTRIVELETELKMLSSRGSKFKDLPEDLQKTLIEVDSAPERRLRDEDS
jgi:uncharacterized protein YecT (DUF1311 family)